VRNCKFKFNSSSDGRDCSIWNHRLSTVLRESRTTVTEISNNRVQHRGDDYDSIENEFAIECLKHTNVVQTSDVGLCQYTPTNLLNTSYQSRESNRLRFSSTKEKPSHSSKPNFHQKPKQKLTTHRNCKTVDQIVS